MSKTVLDENATKQREKKKKTTWLTTIVDS